MTIQDAFLRFVAVVSMALVLAGCTGGHAIARRDTAGLPALAWFSPTVPSDRRTLAQWSAGVGPPVVRHIGTPALSAAHTLRVISWNTALGTADVIGLLRDLDDRLGRAHTVLLLQEAYRGGPEVPGGRLRARFAARLDGGGGARTEVEALADALGFNLYYVPSMRNGAPWDSDEDRGNAILSSLPLDDLSAIELPFERQRRVAIAATVSGTSSSGTPWRLRVMSSHLDNLVGLRRGWFVGGQFARVRQTRALLDHLNGDDAVVLGGDFNTWLGFRERAYAELASEFPDTDVRDRRPTFMGLLRLDHLFFRLPDGWHGAVHRADSRYGSDHYPLVGTVVIESES